MLLRNQIDRLLKHFEHTFATHNRIEVSASALRHNLGLFKRLGGMQVIPVLKGNAYGHGIQTVAAALQGSGVPYLAVDGYFEALRIREVSRQPVLVMGAILPENFPRIKYDNFAFVVQDKQSIVALGATGKRIKVHLECNTGMNRYGARPVQMAELTKVILAHKNLQLEGVMSHLADSDGTKASTVDAAVAEFDHCVEAVRAAGGQPTLLHVAQSAGSLRARSRLANTMRLGIGLYGLNPFPSGHSWAAKLVDIRPALRFVSTITKVIELQKGEQVSYNYTFTAPKAMKIGVIPVGYYEGLNRALSNKGVVKISAHYAPIVGRICMNLTMINLEGTDARLGDEVVVYSHNPADRNAIDSIAAEHKLFNYNLLTALSSDVRRVLVP